MISKEMKDQYIVTVGIECHVQLKTKTKLFAAVGNDAREAPPNTLVSHICFGLPGALPVLNEEAVRLATRAAFALGTEPERFSKFDRKHYFYPDLPKGYQISQYDQPIIGKGHIDVPLLDEATKEVRTFRVGITRAHLEEDAGKSTHPAGKDYSLVDLNRAGTPLLEIVSEPDMHSSAEAKAYARELYLRMKYADVSDCDLYLGHMRFDVNTSVSKDPNKFGTRTETKNLNSFRSVEKAIEYEVIRQIEVLEKGGEIVQETRGWDDAKQRTFTQRGKEEAHDYRYMPDPDLPPIVLDDAYVETIKANVPMLPAEWRIKLAALDLDYASVETLLEKHTENGSLTVIELLLVNDGGAASFAAKYLSNDYLKRDDEVKSLSGGAEAARLTMPTANQFRDVFALVKSGQVSSTTAKNLLFNVRTLGQDADLAQFAKQQGMIQVSDEGEIAKAVAQVIAENPKAVEDLKAGQERAIGFLVGQIMKQTHGKANPALAQKLIKEQLEL